MSGLKNSPFGKRLRAARQGQGSDDEGEQPRRKAPRGAVLFGASDPDLGAGSSTRSPSASPERRGRPRERDSRERERTYGDRFVPSRERGDMRATYNLLDESAAAPRRTAIPTESDAVKEQANTLFTSILHTEVAPTPPSVPASPARGRAPSSGDGGTPSTPHRRRIFAFSSPAPDAVAGRRLDAPTDAAYSLSPIRPASAAILASPRRDVRGVCKTPYRVLDAPELADDFYLNLVDWAGTNVLGVGLGMSVYLWTAHTAAVSKLCDLSSTADTISAVAWTQRGSTLAIGTMNGRMHIYDASTQQCIRSYQDAHEMRIGALGWTSNVLTSGSRDRQIHHRDVREPGGAPWKRSVAHRQEVCGLKWSGDGAPHAATLASGGNDNKVCIWDLRGSRRAPDDAPDVPLWKFHEHTAAVKALAWDPHVSGLLASGGGTQDKHIRFWNVLNGQMLHELDSGSQVCNLIWSLNSHELVSTHGFSSTTAQNQICIWKYPAQTMVASLTGHTHRVLYLAMSPEGETIVTGAGDETLRFWNAFPKRGEARGEDESALSYDRLIR